VEELLDMSGKQINKGLVVKRVKVTDNKEKVFLLL
jgi:hypothetical protein